MGVRVHTRESLGSKAAILVAELQEARAKVTTLLSMHALAIPPTRQAKIMKQLWYILHLLCWCAFAAAQV